MHAAADPLPLRMLPAGQVHARVEPVFPLLENAEVDEPLAALHVQVFAPGVAATAPMGHAVQPSPVPSVSWPLLSAEYLLIAHLHVGLAELRVDAPLPHA